MYISPIIGQTVFAARRNYFYTFLMVKYFLSKGVSVGHYIPDREGEGYGMNVAALKKIKEQGAELIITVDNGITAISEIEEGKAMGLDFVVTDHISVAVTGSEKLSALLAADSAEFKTTVLCDELVFEARDGYTKEWDINGENVTISVSRL